MKKLRFISLILIIVCLAFSFAACTDKPNDSEKDNDVDIVQKDSDTHYLKFMENNAEVLRLVVLKGETYDDLLPYFPTLTQEDGYIKYWDGDYAHTEYSKDNQFVVYSDKDLIIEIYAYMVKAS